MVQKDSATDMSRSAWTSKASRSDNTLNESGSFRNAGLDPPVRPITHRIGQGHTILLTGPVQFKLSEGRAECFGAPITPDTWITVEELRQEPILATEPAALEVKIGPDGSWKELVESTIPTGWTEAAHILQRQQGVAVIVGEADSGKSSLCTFLANMCVQNGLKVGVIDADVGQADIGPPTTISSSLVSEPILTLQDLRQETSFFIGDTSPSSVPDKLTRLIVRLKENLVGYSELVLVNTDGWVGDSAALRFKDELIHETRPDLVLGLSRGSEIDPLLGMVSCASIRLPSSIYARTRSKEERKSARETGYRRFLLDSKSMKINQGNTTLRMFDRSEQQVLRWDRKLKGFLSGLLDDHQELLGIGRIREMIDGYALVETRTTERPRFLEIGNILLSSKYEEIGYRMLH